MKDLWPNDIVQLSQRTPVSILKEQASLLGARTKNIVTAEVLQLEDSSNHDFNYQFYLVGPALQNYHYGLFTVSYSINLYPSVFTLDIDIIEEFRIAQSDQLRQLDFMLNPLKFSQENKIMVENEEQLTNLLKLIFAAQKTRRVIAAILGQSTDKILPNDDADAAV